jgi:hypothetical protein
VRRGGAVAKGQNCNHPEREHLRIGPLPKSDSGLMRRMRFHQAWYRAEVMGLNEFGRLFGSDKPCGTVLADRDAQEMKNFVGDEAARHYQSRRARGWGVDPFRCTKYMTSSQTLTFNMFGQAVGRPCQCAALFNALLGRADLVRLDQFHFEFSPAGTEYSLGDRTLIDLLLKFRTMSGEIQIVCVETKLADRFSTRRTAAMGGDRYAAIQEAFDVWRNMGDALEDNRTRQLVRCHALAHSVQQRDNGHTKRRAQMLTLLHPDDAVGGQATSTYESCVVERSTAKAVTWDHYLREAANVGAVDRDVSQRLSDRYVNLAGSCGAWSGHVSGEPSIRKVKG